MLLTTALAFEHYKMTAEGIEITSASALRAYSDLYRKTSHGDAAHQEETHHRDIEQSGSHYEEHPRPHVEVESSIGSDDDSDQAWEASRRRKKRNIVVTTAVLFIFVVGLSALLTKHFKDNSAQTMIASAEAADPGGTRWPTYSPSVRAYSNDVDDD